MESEDFGDVLERRVDDVVYVLFDVLVVGQRVALVELEGGLQQRVAEPHVRECQQESLVEVIRLPTAVLNLKRHSLATRIMIAWEPYSVYWMV